LFGANRAKRVDIDWGVSTRGKRRCLGKSRCITITRARSLEQVII